MQQQIDAQMSFGYVSKQVVNKKSETSSISEITKKVTSIYR